MSKKAIRYLIISIVSGLVFVGCLAFLLVLTFTGNINTYPFLFTLFLVILPIMAIVFVFALIRYINIHQTTVSLRNENLYNLGQAYEFFDLHAFEAAVATAQRNPLLRRVKQHVMAFSAANQTIMQNTNRDDSISHFSARIASYLEELFREERKNNRHNTYIFCFNRGLFLVYLFTDDEHHIKELVNKISEKLFKIAEEDQIRIWVQPFFGVAEITRENSIVEAIENASIARNVSERNFESLTYYHESFRRRSSKSDIEEITNALREGEFVVYYQPKFNLSTRRFISSEALVRWNSKKHGLLPPSKFIPLAEAAGLIHEIDTYVFERVCEDLNEAKRRGRRIIPVSINFSLYEFYSSDFLNSIVSSLEKYKINPSYIEIEITEATSQANTFISISIIKKLRDRGIRVLMDDFGVGFSNIGNLRKIPFDAVKIDKSFIDDISFDNKSKAIVKFLIELCQANDLEVIAEGVDSKDQVEILKKLKCNTIQGFYYSKALPIKEYEKFLVNNPFERKEGADL